MKKSMNGILIAALTGTMILGVYTDALAAGLSYEDMMKAAQEAKETALKAVGVTEEQVIIKKMGKNIEDGNLIFEVDFFIPGEEKYEVDIDPVTGAVKNQEREQWEAENDIEYASFLEKGVEKPDEEKFKEIISTVLEDAGVAKDEVIFKKTGADIDDGRQIYEIDFFIPGKMKYEFDIDPDSGKILTRETDTWDSDDDVEYAAFISGEETAETGEFTAEDAKASALADAGLTENEVTFVKSKKEVDDGVEKYEIEFVDGDGLTHEYDILASDGTILEKEVDYDD